MDTFQIVPQSEILDPAIGVLRVATFDVGPIPIQFQAIDSWQHPDILMAAIKFEKRYMALININGITWYWHGSDDIENLISFHNYIINEFKLGKVINVTDVIGVRPNIAISYQGLDLDPRGNSSR